jgi:hypothetical protein
LNSLSAASRPIPLRGVLRLRAGKGFSRWKVFGRRFAQDDNFIINNCN